LGAIIEELTKKSYRCALRERILDVIKIENTDVYEYNTIIKGLANGYHVGEGMKLSNMPFAQPNSAFSAGYLYSTVGDFLKWSRALYTDQLLPANLRDEMLKPHKLASSLTKQINIGCLYFSYGFMVQYLDPETWQPPSHCPENPDDIPKNLIKTYFYSGSYPGGFKAVFMRIPHIPGKGKEKISIMVFSNWDNFVSLFLAFQIRSILLTGMINRKVTIKNFLDVIK
jgi:CubicO group peptidase (beta-lactamase class C family)